MVIIKSKSAEDFLKRHVVSSPETLRCHPSEISFYHYFRDDIFLRKEGLPAEIQVGKPVKFLLADKTRATDTPIFNGYVYSVSDYDNHSIKLTLESFKILMSEDEDL